MQTAVDLPYHLPGLRRCDNLQTRESSLTLEGCALKSHRSTGPIPGLETGVTASRLAHWRSRIAQDRSRENLPDQQTTPMKKRTYPPTPPSEALRQSNRPKSSAERRGRPTHRRASASRSARNWATKYSSSGLVQAHRAKGTSSGLPRVRPREGRQRSEGLIEPDIATPLTHPSPSTPQGGGGLRPVQRCSFYALLRLCCAVSSPSHHGACCSCDWHATDMGLCCRAVWL